MDVALSFVGLDLVINNFSTCSGFGRSLSHFNAVTVGPTILQIADDCSRNGEVCPVCRTLFCCTVQILQMGQVSSQEL